MMPLKSAVSNFLLWSQKQNAVVLCRIQCQKHNKWAALQLKVAVRERELDFWTGELKNLTLLLQVYSEIFAVPRTQTYSNTIQFLGGMETFLYGNKGKNTAKLDIFIPFLQKF